MIGQKICSYGEIWLSLKNSCYPFLSGALNYTVVLLLYVHDLYLNLLMEVPYLFGYKTGFHLSKMTTNNLISSM